MAYLSQLSPDILKRLTSDPNAKYTDPSGMVYYGNWSAPTQGNDENAALPAQFLGQLIGIPGLNAPDGSQMASYDANGNFAGYGTTGVQTDFMDRFAPIMAAGILGGGALAASGLGGAAAGASGAEGAGAAGAGFLGDATAAGYGGLDAASAATMGGGASIGGGAALGSLGGAGAVGGYLGDATAAGYGGLDAAGASSLGGGGAAINGGAGSSALGSLGSSASNLLSGVSTNGLIGAGLNAVSGLVGANASKNAANTQAQSAANALALEKQMFDKQVELQQPWHDTGVSGLNMLSQYLGLKPSDGSAGTSYGSLMKPFSMADYQADPGYGFRMQQGNQALDRSAAARGGLLSGRAAKDTLNYSQGLASQEYGNAYNRYNTNQTNQYNRLASTAGLGQTAASTIGNAAQSYGNNAANLITSSGAAQAAGQVGSANALTGGLASAWNAYQNNQLLNRLLPGYGT